MEKLKRGRPNARPLPMGSVELRELVLQYAENEGLTMMALLRRYEINNDSFSTIYYRGASGPENLMKIKKLIKDFKEKYPESGK